MGNDQNLIQSDPMSGRKTKSKLKEYTLLVLTSSSLDLLLSLQSLFIVPVPWCLTYLI